MALFKISKGLAANLAKNVPNAKEGFAYFTSDDGKFYIDIAGDGTTATPAIVGTNRIPLNAYISDLLKASTMSTTDGEVYRILAFKTTDTAKSLVEAKYGTIGFKNGALVIPDNANKDEILIKNKTSGNAIKIENTSTNGYSIEITGSGKGIKVAADPTEALEVATKQYVDKSFAANDAMIFKGTVSSNDDLPATHEAGWTYKVNVAGIYAGQKCEVGDLVICIVDGITTNNSHWTIGQTNTDVFVGATADVAGSIGLVPAPKAGDESKYLKADGTWGVPLNLQEGNAISIDENESNITIGVKDDVFADVSHNHDNDYVKKSGDTMTGNLILTKTDTSDVYCQVNNSNNTIGIFASTNGGLYDFQNSKWIVYHNTFNNLNYFDGYCITTKGAKGLPIIATDYGSMGIGSRLNFFQTGTETPYNGSILCKSDWNFLGKNKLYLQGTTTTAADLPTVLYFGSQDTDTGITDYSYIATYSGHGDGNYGGKMIINGGQALAIGSGESAMTCYQNKLKTTNTEDMYITSDATIYFYTNCDTWANHTEAVKIDTAGKLWGAVWNDYAEMREGDTIEAGKCVIEVGDDTLTLSSERMQPGANITSDTFGFAIGETDKCKTPIAVSGRVLAYGYEDREEFKKNIGRPVCSGPNGTVSIMTDEEYKEKGYCAIGTISAVPDYEEWGTGNVKVDGRIWIKVF